MSLYTGLWTPFPGNVIGSFANGCEYSGPSISSFGPSDPVMQCGPQCQATHGCVYFTFVGNATDDTSVGVCTLFGNNTVGDSTTALIPTPNFVTGPWAANATNVCGFFGRDGIPSTAATTTFSTETATPELTASTQLSTSTGTIAATANSNGTSFNVSAIFSIIVTAVVLFIAIITWQCICRANKKQLDNTVDLRPKINPPTPNNRKNDIYVKENIAAAAARKKMEWEEVKQQIPIGLSTIEMHEVKGNAFVKMPHCRISGK